MVLFVNPLTPRVKPWVIQSFLTFDSMYRTLKCDHSLFVFSLTQFVMLENLSIFDMVRSETVKQEEYYTIHISYIVIIVVNKHDEFHTILNFQYNYHIVIDVWECEREICILMLGIYKRVIVKNKQTLFSIDVFHRNQL